MFRNWVTAGIINLIELGWVNDRLTRAGIRYLCRQRLNQVSNRDAETRQQKLQQFIAEAASAPIAPLAEKANEQHYEIPAAFYDLVLGPQKKYSRCLYDRQTNGLEQAETDALQTTCERAELRDGQDILELGCGWGSLTLWMAEHYPNSKITAVSNSNSQREHILGQAAFRGVGENLTVLTVDMNDFESEQQFDRVVSVEMFEHMRNHQALLSKVANWLRADGKLFVHIFCHREFTYAFETEGSSNWMGRYFFTGGIMPSKSLFSNYEDDLKIAQQWTWNGKHYEQTSNHWLENLDQNRNQVLSVLEDTYGRNQAKRWLNRWRVFFMACAELFGADDGEQWYVAHYLFEKSKARSQMDLSNNSLAGPSGVPR